MSAFGFGGVKPKKYKSKKSKKGHIPKLTGKLEEKWILWAKSFKEPPQT